MEKKKWKLPLETGLSALCGHIRNVRNTAEQTGSAVSDLAAAMAAVTGEIEEALDEKQDRGAAVSFTVPVDGWTRDDDGSGYPYRYDLTVNGVTAGDRADVTISPLSGETAVRCGLCPASETMAGIIRLRAAARPTAKITAEYWLSGGKEQ